jgi:ribonuclease P protein component
MYWQIAEKREEKNSQLVMSSTAQPKIISIKNKREIQHLLEGGKKIFTRFGTFFLAKQDACEYRLAVLVKKNIGNAVQRNYSKRVIKEYIRLNIDRFTKYNEIIFVITKQINVPSNELEMELEKVFLKK